MLRFARAHCRRLLSHTRLMATGSLKGNNTLAIRREDKNRWERRAPLAPSHVKTLVGNGVKVYVQPSTLRIFRDEEYTKAGAIIQEDITPASVILGVKEVPIHKLIPNRTMVFFAHVIKAQSYNMPLLDAILENNIRLIDYERIVDGDNNRLVRFGAYAGYAGMIDFLHGFGNRLLALGYSTPFLHVGYTHMYEQLDNARNAVRAMGEAIKAQGYPRALGPLVFVFTGTGSVSRGAQDIINLLPVEWVSPDELPKLVANKKFDNHTIYCCVSSSVDSVRRKDGKKFSKSDYYAHPDKYESVFAERFAQYASVIVNCAYWDQRYPRFLTYAQTRELVREQRFRLLGLADISADSGGSIEWMRRLTTIDYPFYIFDPDTEEEYDDISSERGVLVTSVDNLPTEIPYEASRYFGDSLLPWVENLVNSDGSKPFEKQTDLAKALRSAVITAHGKLTPDYEYIDEFRRENENAQARKSVARHRVLVLGAGNVAPPLIKYLARFAGVQVTVASNELARAKKIAESRSNVRTRLLDVGNADELRTIVQAHDVVVSLLPATMHVPIAKLCISLRKNLVTTSYLSPELEALNEEAERAGVTVLNEVGLDPGYDHLLAMRVISETRESGGELLSFVSYCGGLPAPEHSENPLGYKFSWSPRGVLLAGLNGAKFRWNGELVDVQPGSLFEHAERVDMWPGYNLEGLPNRDSTLYAELYGVPDTPTFMRGTLRYGGFSAVMSAITSLGYCEQAPTPMLAKGAPPVTWRSVLMNLLNEETAVDVEGAVMRRLELPPELAVRVQFAMHWLGLFSDDEYVPQVGSLLDALCVKMQEKMPLLPDERDLVVLRHVFRVRSAAGREECKVSSVVVYGDSKDSAMSKTVGLPCGIATKLLLNQHIIRRGVLRPTTPDIYVPMLTAIERETPEIASIEQTFAAGDAPPELQF